MQVAPWQDGHYLLAQLPVAASSTPRTLPSEIGLLWDGSGSAGQRDRTREFALLDRYFAALGDGSVALTVLRDRAEPVRRFRIRAGNWSELRAALQAVRPDGASALAQWQPQSSVKEYLLFSDGLLTYGPEQLPAMAPDQRLFAVSSAARTDAVRLRGWSEAHGGRFVALGKDVDAAAHALLASPLDVQVDAGAACRTWSSTVAVKPRVGCGCMHDWQPTACRCGCAGGGEWQALPATQKSDDGELLAGLWAQARLQQLAVDRRGNREAMQRLSQQFGLVGPDTSLIVLETLEDYLRYAIRPSGKLRTDYDARFARQVTDRAAADRERLDQVAARWKERQQWWSRSWPAPPRAKEAALHVASADYPAESAPMAMLVAPAPAAPPAACTDGRGGRTAHAGQQRTRASSGARVGECTGFDCGHRRLGRCRCSRQRWPARHPAGGMAAGLGRRPAPAPGAAVAAL